jgi:hypothetical protein
MLNKVSNLVVKENELLNELRQRRMSPFNKQVGSPQPKGRQSIMYKKSITKDEGKLNEQRNSSEKKRSKRYSTVKSKELAEILKAKDVGKETEKLIQREKEKEKERINGFTDWVHRKRVISDRQKVHKKEKFLSFLKS